MSTSCRGAACYVGQEIGTGQYAVDTPELAGGKIKPRERTSRATVRELGVRECRGRLRSGSTYRFRVIPREKPMIAADLGVIEGRR